MRRPVRTLLIDDGGLPGLVACALHQTPDMVTLWRPGALIDASAESAAAEAVRRRAEAYGVGAVEIGATTEPGPLRATRAILSACEAALLAGCRVVLWPACLGDDIRTLAAESERLRLTGFLVGVDASESVGPLLTIETPYLDLTVDQMADLALDTDVPTGEGWWWSADRAGWDGALRRAASRRGWGVAGSTQTVPAAAAAPA